jgi:diguanylate cyclase (GGDEF)-like protein
MGIRRFLNQLLEPEEGGAPTGAPSSPAETRPVLEEGDPALVRVLADTLRAVGEGAFDMDDLDGDSVRARFDDLARRVESADAESLRALPETVATHRRRERHWVTRMVRDMGETVVGLITRLGRNVALDRASDGRVGEQLQRLRGAVDKENLAQVRREVLSAVETIGSAMKERDDRQRTEMATISRQLESLKAELTHTRKEMALDGLTRLYNRPSLDEHLENVASISVLSGRSSSLLMVDIDHFKKVNDTWGHQAGDAVLRAVADLLVKCFPRRSDFVGRFGGEEFAIVLGEDGQSTGAMLAGRMLERCRELVVPWEGQEIQVTLSVGVAGFAGSESVREWVGRADKALYEAKSTGRDRVVQAAAEG